MTRIVRVTRRQVASAQALVKLSGGLDKVDPLIRKIATAKPLARADAEDRESGQGAVSG